MNNLIRRQFMVDVAAGAAMTQDPRARARDLANTLPDAYDGFPSCVKRDDVIDLLTNALADERRNALEEAATICETVSFTQQGPSPEAKRQRQLCANTIRAQAGRVT